MSSFYILDLYHIYFVIIKYFPWYSLCIVLKEPIFSWNLEESLCIIGPFPPFPLMFLLTDYEDFVCLKFWKYIVL